MTQAIANQFGLNSTFVNQMNAMPNISTEQVLGAAMDASKDNTFKTSDSSTGSSWSEWLNAALGGLASSGGQFPGGSVGSGTNTSGTPSLSEQDVTGAKQAATWLGKGWVDLIAILIGVIIIAVSVYKLA